jgi:hypothetical protein
MYPKLSGEIAEKLKRSGKNLQQIEEQLKRFEEGFPDLEIDRPATPGDGIIRINPDDEQQLLDRYRQARLEGRTMKFVPASGAATRMFKTLQAMLNSDDKLHPEYMDAHPDDEDVAYTLIFLDRLESFAFYDDLKARLAGIGHDPSELIAMREYRKLLSFILDEEGLGLASLPKALIPFHKYPDHNRTPMEEHLVEAIAYTRGENGNIRIHFTISPEYEEKFRKRLEEVRPRYETAGVQLFVETSYQKPETDTIAVDPDNKPFLDDNGEPVLRPGGHGALLVNLQELKGDIVFIKNIDNIVPDHLKETTIHYKKLLGGYLLTIRDRIFSYLKELDRGNTDRRFIEEIITFIRDELYINIPEAFTGKNEMETSRWLFQRLNRPIRVCGMVINEGEPGGGPFIVRHPDGTTSLQIVEDAQINLDNPRQRELFNASTHFNPTDLVCSLRDFHGRPFDLEKFRDPDTGFISTKSYQGRDLKALELPGLWNGSMAHWNSIFIEIPAELFNPVKTMNDLLRKEHSEFRHE